MILDFEKERCKDKCIEVLKSEQVMYACLAQAEKIKMVDKVIIYIILCLGVRVLGTSPQIRVWLRYEQNLNNYI